MQKLSRLALSAVSIGFLCTPAFALADQVGAINTTYINGYKVSIVSIINDYLVPVLIAVAFIVFLYGVYKFFIAGASEEGAKGEGRRFAAWGIVGFVIILSLWGIVNIVKDTLIPSDVNTSVPKYPTL